MKDLRLAVLIWAGLLLLAQPTIGNTNKEPYPLEYFALRDVVSSVRISPDGQQLAMMKIPTREGNPVLEIYDATDLSKEPYRVNADPMEIVGYFWVGSQDIVLSLRQKVRERIQGFNRGVYEGKLAKLDLRSKKIRAFDEVNANIASLLPHKPNKVILSFNQEAKAGSRAGRQFRPASYYEFDLTTGKKKLLIRGKISLGQIRFDGHGNPRIGVGFDQSSGDTLYYYRAVGSKKWEEIYRLSEDSFETFSIVGIDDTKPDTLFVAAHNGNDTSGIWEFDAKSKAFTEAIYARSDIDVGRVRYHSDRWNHPDRVVAISYSLDKQKHEYFDGAEAALYQQLEAAIPNAHNVSITSRAKDASQVMTVYNVGPKDPGTYYLMRDGKLEVIGSKLPMIKQEDLAEVQYVKYKARDGQMIRAFVTIPHGEGPFPTIVMPHGGPFVQEVVVYDEWAQMLANRGYLVLQPQYRGSRGYGLKFYQAAFMDGGQGGRKMQDDKDDGVKYLIKKGLTDPDNVAMFGWSYGGYAALIAASREDQLYQCVIAGAAVTDTQHQINYYRDRVRGSAKIEQENMWLDSLSPIKEVSKVNVPILLIHGSVDQRVPMEHAERYLKALDKHEKNYEYVQLDGADHFSNTLFFNHQKKLYESMIGFLENKCGPGGI